MADVGGSEDGTSRVAGRAHSPFPLSRLHGRVTPLHASRPSPGAPSTVARESSIRLNAGSSRSLLPSYSDAHESKTRVSWTRKLEGMFFNLMYAMCEENRTWQNPFVSYSSAVLDFVFVLTFTMGTGNMDAKGTVVAEAGNALTWSGFLMIHHLLVVLIAVVVALLVGVGVMSEMQNIKVLWPIRIVRTIVVFFLTIGYLPLLRIIITPLICTSESTLAAFTEEQIACWEGDVISEQFVAIGTMVVFVPMCLLVSLLFFESQHTSSLPMARFSARIDFGYLLGKTVLILLEPLSQEAMWMRTLRTLLLLIVFAAIESSLLLTCVYYKRTARRLKSAIFCGLVLLCFAALIVNGAVPASLMLSVGIPIQVALALFGAGAGVLLVDWRTRRFASRSSTYRVSSVSETPARPPGTRTARAQGCFRRLVLVSKMQDLRTRLDAVLLAYIPLEHAQQTAADHPAARGEFLPGDIAQSLAALQQGMSRQPHSAWLAAQTANFLATHRPGSEATVTARRAEKLNPSLDVRFLLFCIRKRLDYASSGTGNGGRSFDIVSRMEMQRMTRLVIRHENETVRGMLRFWELTLTPNINILAVLRTSERISAAEARAQELYSVMLRRAPNDAGLLRRYSLFVQNVENDSEKAQDCAQLADLLEQLNIAGTSSTSADTDTKPSDGSSETPPTLATSASGTDSVGSAAAEDKSPDALRSRILGQQATARRDAIRKLAKFSIIEQIHHRTILALAVSLLVAWIAVIVTISVLPQAQSSLECIQDVSTFANDVAHVPMQARAAQQTCASEGDVAACTTERTALGATADALLAARSKFYDAAKADDNIWGSPVVNAWGAPSVSLSEYGNGALLWTHSVSPFDMIASIATYLDVLAASHATMADATSSSLHFLLGNADAMREAVHDVVVAYQQRMLFTVLQPKLSMAVLLTTVIIGFVSMDCQIFRPAFAQLREDRAATFDLLRHIPKRDVARLVHHLRSIAHTSDDHRAVADESDNDTDEEDCGEDDAATVTVPSAGDDALDQPTTASTESTLMGTRQATESRDTKYRRRYSIGIASLVAVFLATLILTEVKCTSLDSFSSEAFLPASISSAAIACGEVAQELRVEGANNSTSTAQLTDRMKQRLRELRDYHRIVRFGTVDDRELDTGSYSGCYGRNTAMDTLLDTTVEPLYMQVVASVATLASPDGNASATAMDRIVADSRSLSGHYSRLHPLFLDELKSKTALMVVWIVVATAVSTLATYVSYEILKRMSVLLRRDADNSCHMLAMIPADTIRAVPRIRQFFGGATMIDTPRSTAARFYAKQVSVARSAGAHEDELRDLCKLARLLLYKGQAIKTEEHLARARALAERLLSEATEDPRDPHRLTALSHHDVVLGLLQQTQVAHLRADAAFETAEVRRLVALPDRFGGRHELPDWARTAVSSDKVRQMVQERHATIVAYSLVQESRWDSAHAAETTAWVLYTWVMSPVQRRRQQPQQQSLQQQRRGQRDEGTAFARTDVAHALGGVSLEEMLERLHGSEGLGVRISGTDGADEMSGTDDGSDETDTDIDGDAPVAAPSRRRGPHCLFDILRALYLLFIAPQERALFPSLPSKQEEAGRPTIVFVADEGIVYDVPFGALLNHQKVPLCARAVMALTPSVAAFCHTRADRIAATAVTASGGLAVGNPQPADVPMLLEALRETQIVRNACRLAPSNVLNGFAATKAAVLGQLDERPQCVHLCAHTGVNADGVAHVVLAHDETLDESEIAATDLSHTNMVVLSVCSTGAGQRSAAGGMVRLAWAFLAAGAGAVVCPLWSVDEVLMRQYVHALYRAFSRTDGDGLAAARASAVALTTFGGAEMLCEHIGVWGALSIFDGGCRLRRRPDARAPPSLGR